MLISGYTEFELSPNFAEIYFDIIQKLNKIRAIYDKKNF